jgi:hypothetical protein
MQFNIDQDLGASISAWVVPDNPDAMPKVLISAPGREAVELTANRSRPDIRDLGLHTTGMVGFWIDHSIIPDLEAWTDLSVHEVRSQVLIHRRHTGIPHKVFLLDTSMDASTSLAIENQLKRHFTLPYEAIERYPFDTLFSILNNQSERSIFACGRLPLVRYLNILRANGFICSAVLKHPFEDLGSRLEIAHQAARGMLPNVADYVVGLEPLVELMTTINLGDLGGLQTAMHSLTAAQATAISNPLVKILACVNDETPHRDHVAQALENLAAIDLVGSYSRFDSFQQSLCEILNQQVLEACPEASFAAKEIAGVLARIEPVRRLLSLDLALHSYIEDAFAAADAELQKRVEGSDRSVL